MATTGKDRQAERGLLYLPAELLFDIHLLSVSPSLPILTRHTVSLFQHTTSFHRASYLWRTLHLQHPSIGQTSKASMATYWDAQLRYPCCTLEVVELLRRWEEKAGRKLYIKELPKRLFKYLSSSDPSRPLAEPDPLLSALLNPPYSVSPDRRGGYPLSRAVLARDLRLIRDLLDAGASPATKDALPVRVAVGTGDLDVVRMLVEPDFRSPEEAPPEASASMSADYSDADRPSSDGHNLEADGRRRLVKGAWKRRKVADRVQVSDGMLESAIKRGFFDLAAWLMTKGATPTMNALRLLEAGSRGI